MNAKNYNPAPPRMSYGPTIDDMRASIIRAEAEGIAREDMLLRLTFRDASLIKRSPCVGVDEVSFADGEMRFLGVKIITVPITLSVLEAPAQPIIEPEPPAKKTKAKAKPKALTAKAKAALAAAEAAEAAEAAAEEAEEAAEVAEI